jgi:hypothetical protein
MNNRAYYITFTFYNNPVLYISITLCIYEFGRKKTRIFSIIIHRRKFRLQLLLLLATLKMFALAFIVVGNTYLIYLFFLIANVYKK